MALRARLSAPREEKNEWKWHEIKWSSLPISAMWNKDRRLEAENYLTTGYSVRIAMESNKNINVRLGDMVRVWQPSRLKGIQVSRKFGTPFLAATQVFDLRPTPRKFLSLDRTDNYEDRFVKNGTIVVTCSGSVGRATLTYSPHENTLISHDLLRVEPNDLNYWGWIYAFLRSEQAQAMMKSAQYGHVIKHLEPEHLNALPLPIPNRSVLEEFQNDVLEVMNKRNSYWALQSKAEELFEQAVGVIEEETDLLELPHSISASELFVGRRRLEAGFHSPLVRAILNQFKETGLCTQPLGDLSERIWWLSRFKRVFGEEGGVRYLSADELFSINPPITKRVMIEQAENADEFFVKAGWIVMACSGQTYGLNGSVSLMTKWHEDSFLSHDLVRIIPKADEIHPGYLYTVLGHPTLGRPLVIRNAYGTSIPHLDPSDIATVPIVRLDARVEEEIGGIMEQAVRLRVEADILENALSAKATRIINGILAGHSDV
jgi:hypothetical protein